MSLLDTVKKVAVQSAESTVPAAILYGTVKSENPLIIRVDDRFDVTGDALIVPKELKAGYYATHRHSGFSQGAETQSASGGSGETAFAPHSHGLKEDYWTNSGAESEYYYGLRQGEKVILLRNAGGQQYLILGRV